MKRIIVALVFGISIFFVSCEKEGVSVEKETAVNSEADFSKYEGTWVYRTEGSSDEDYSLKGVANLDKNMLKVLQSDNLLPFPDGAGYLVDYYAPHLFFAGSNFFDVVSASAESIVLKKVDGEMERLILSKAENNGIQSLVGEWSITKNEGEGEEEVWTITEAKFIFGGHESEGVYYEDFSYYTYLNPFVSFMGTLYEVIKTGESTIAFKTAFGGKVSYSLSKIK